MAYGVIMCCHLHMPLYILGTFTEYPSAKSERIHAYAIGQADLAPTSFCTSHTC